VKRILYSILDLAPIRQGGDAAMAFRNTLDLAKRAERWGHRYWLTSNGFGREQL
jgi:pyruvate-formate lyase-activating enzyme